MKRLVYILTVVAALACSAAAQEVRNLRLDDTVDAFRTVRVERAALSKKADKVEEGQRVQIAFSTYDERGNLVQSIISSRQGSPFVVYKAQYAADLSLVEEGYTGLSGPSAKFVTTYDAAARKAETAGFDAKGRPLSRAVYAFDESGRIAEEAHYDKGGRLLERVVFTYQAGTVEQTRAYDQGRMSYRIVTTPNAQGRPADEKYYRPDGSLIFQEHRSYDERGNCTDEVLYAASGGLHWRHGYEYDARGNWTARRTFRQTLNRGLPEYEPVEVIYRSITYYEAAENGPAPARASEAERARVRATAGLLPGEVVEQTPLYNPGRTVSTGVTGQITVLMVIDEYGSVLSALALSGFDKLLNSLAETVTTRWRFNPTLKGGHVVPVVRARTFEYKPDFR